MLKLHNIDVKYNKVMLVLRGISMEVADENIVALLGANGAGKTTTLKAISCLLSTEMGEVTHGHIEFDGKRIDKLEPEDIVYMGISQVMEGRRLFKQLSIDENLKAGAYMTRSNSKMNKDIDMIYGYFPKLRDMRKSTVGYCSGGEQQMLAIGRSLVVHPKLLLLDEPSLGLAPIMIETIFKIIKQINEKEKTAMLLVEQNAVAALGIARYGYVMESGRIVMSDDAANLRENDAIREFYLGLGQLGERKSYRDVKHYKKRNRWVC